MASETSKSDIKAVLAQLQAQRDRIDAAMAVLRQLDATGTVSGTVPTIVVSDQAQDEMRSDSFFGMSIPEAAKKYLSIVKKSQSTQEIADALESGGMTHTSKNWGNTVQAGIARNAATAGEIVKVRRGVWGLAEWYPGRKRGGGE